MTKPKVPAVFVFTSWDDVPQTCRLHHLAAIYALNEWTVRRHVETGHPSIPRPAFIHPYRWRKADVRAHYEGAKLSDQRRGHAQMKRVLKTVAS